MLAASSARASSVGERIASKGLEKVGIRTASTALTTMGKRAADALPDAATAGSHILTSALLAGGRDRGVRCATSALLEGIELVGRGTLRGVQSLRAELLCDLLVLAEGADGATMLGEVVEQVGAAAMEANGSVR